MLKALPAGFFAGLRLRSLTGTECSISVPYKWMTRNPFKSTYFASLLMAAEMSTGLPAWAAVRNSRKRISMLVTHVEADYFKKAAGLTIFTCTQVREFEELVNGLKEPQDKATLIAESRGLSETGELVAVCRITWSFALKK